MILRRWRGAVRAADAESYLEYIAGTGVREYRETPGNLGAMMVSRPLGDLVEVVTYSLWESMDAVRAFAGEDPEQARFYPRDEEALVERGERVEHFDVADVGFDPSLVAGA